jgi:hypothetical protein
VWSRNNSQLVPWIRATVLMEVRVVSVFRTAAMAIPSTAPVTPKPPPTNLPPVLTRPGPPLTTQAPFVGSPIRCRTMLVYPASACWLRTLMTGRRLSAFRWWRRRCEFG